MQRFIRRTRRCIRSVGTVTTFFPRNLYCHGSNLSFKTNPSRLFATSSKVQIGNNHSELKQTKESKEKETALRLMDAASSGDLELVRNLVEIQKANVNEGDYDLRKPLHLAAAEGKLEVVKYLLDKGAEISSIDRFGNTCLDDALVGKNVTVIKLLRSCGAQIGKTRKQELGSVLCKLAGEGDVEALQMYVEAGVDINQPDYDRRTPLHLAASEGKIQTVEFLLKHGAQCNAVDRFGNTPLQDANRGRGRHKKAVAQILEEAGAKLGSSEWSVKNDPAARGSIQRSLPILCQRGNFIFSEAWLPTDDDTNDFMFVESYSTDKEIKEQKITSAQNEPNDPKTVMGKVFATKRAILISDVLATDLLPVRQTHASAQAIGLKSAVIVPVLFNNNVVCIFKLFSNSTTTISEKDLEKFTLLCSGMFTAGVFKNEAPVQFNEVPDVPKAQMQEVFRLIVAEEVFNPNILYAELDWYYNLGLQKYYFQRYTASEIANHIHSYIAAKRLAQTTGHPEDIWLDLQSRAKDGSTESALYMTPTDHAKMTHIEKRLQEKIAKIPNAKPYTLEFFMSENTIIPFGTKQLGLYILNTANWANPAKLGTQDKNIWDVASDIFLREKTKLVRDRYQEIMTKALGKLSPVVEVYPTYKDGSIPIMFAFLQGAGTTTSYLLQLTELLKHNQLTATRKFIETFANGLIVYSLYLKEAPDGRLQNLLKQFSMLHLVPESALTALFLSGQFTAQKYTYVSAAAKFIYYFLNRRSEEFNVLANVFKNDPLNLGRLRLLQSRLKREAVSRDRIIHSILNHGPIIEELFKDFEQVATTVKAHPAENKYNIDIAKRIKKEALSELDAQILNGFLTFNAHLLKTNFYNKVKSALAFRLDPKFLAEGDWPTVPFGLFFVMGSEFQGFHVRFRDIARGGIRIIRSANEQVYNTNLESQFAENYGLAYTQNLKNKDIPEFGSKGTILLDPKSQGSAFLAFQKYVSGLLDLLVKRDDIVDNYRKEEILFLGPDEGTADYMEWAARYAEKRGYRYWRSFTTGKPPSLGGIPHDMYGMTTRGVHRYVLNCLKKCGLDERKVTKVQTGGPDGDLGSNEILLSEDKTKAIIDGSGVLYAPNGIDRMELVRLAKARKMVTEFDTSKLGPGGFKVSIKDQNVKLPNGEIVESGLAFRNEFHLHPLFVADMFVPCGGRPEAVNITNVKRLLDEKGKPRFKIIVEGANLFFTQDARMILEDAGVILYKDASANKGGVTSSSLEVLAALSLSEEEFKKHMMVTDPKNIPRFYEEYVSEIQKRIELDADLEFECIWREHERTGTHRYILTDQVSNKINELNDFIQTSSLWKNEELRRTVLQEAVPKRLTSLVPLETILQRVPISYTQAIFGAYLASRYVYRYGLHANEFAFFEFMQELLTKAKKI